MWVLEPDLASLKSSKGCDTASLSDPNASIFIGHITTRVEQLQDYGEETRKDVQGGTPELQTFALTDPITCVALPAVCFLAVCEER